MLTAFEQATWLAAVAEASRQILFTRGKLFVRAFARDGIFWVRPGSPGQPIGQAITPPIVVPAFDETYAEALVEGWVQLCLGESVVWGVEPTSSGTEQSTPNPDQVRFLDAWCETDGSLIVTAH